MSAVLIKAITNTDTTLSVTEGDTFDPCGGTIQIENEQITYSSHYMGQFQLATRGANGTTAVVHIIGTVVLPVEPNMGDCRVHYFNAPGAPTNGVTGQYFAQIGSLYSDTTNGNVYIQTATMASPVWKLVTRAA